MNKKELHKIAPTLSEIKKDGAFSIPENYFNTIEDSVLNELKLASFKASKKNTFKVPEDYFNSVEENVFTKLALDKKELNSDIPKDYFNTIEDRVFETLKKDKKKNKIISFAKYFAPITVAASIAFLLFFNSTNTPVTLESIATTEFEEMIDYGLIDIDSQTLASAFSDITLPTDNLNIIVTDTEVLDYLYEEDLETFMYDY